MVFPRLALGKYKVKKVIRNFGKALLFGAISFASVLPAQTATVNFTFVPSITITNSCVIIRTRRLNFRRHGVLSSNVDRRRAFRINCSTGTNYEIGLDAGTTPGGTTTTRKMRRNTGETVDYMMYQNAARTTNWGNSPGVDTRSGVGTGSNQNIRIYGRVPTQDTPRPGRYRDTVTITIFF